MSRFLALGLFVAICLTSLPQAIGQVDPAVEIVDAAVPVIVVPGREIDVQMALGVVQRIDFAGGGLRLGQLAGAAGASPMTVRLDQVCLVTNGEEAGMITLSVPTTVMKATVRKVMIARVRLERRTRRVPEGTPPPVSRSVGQRPVVDFRSMLGIQDLAASDDPAPVDGKPPATEDSTSTDDEAPIKMIDQTYTVQVPFQVEVEQKVMAPMPGPMQPKQIALDTVQTWTRDGMKLTPDVLMKLLVAEPRPVFPIQRPWPKGFKINAAQKQVLASDTLFMIVGGRVGR